MAANGWIGIKQSLHSAAGKNAWNVIEQLYLSLMLSSITNS